MVYYRYGSLKYDSSLYDRPYAHELEFETTTEKYVECVNALAVLSPLWRKEKKRVLDAVPSAFQQAARPRSKGRELSMGRQDMTLSNRFLMWMSVAFIAKNTALAWLSFLVLGEPLLGWSCVVLAGCWSVIAIGSAMLMDAEKQSTTGNLTTPDGDGKVSSDYPLGGSVEPHDIDKDSKLTD